MNRSSNIELLRIVCMISICVLHIVGFHNIEVDSLTARIVNATCNYGVTCFVLISGFFRINEARNLRKALHLRNTMSFFLLIMLGVRFALYHRITPHLIACALFPIMTGKYWFLTSYFYLLLLAPWLNRLIDISIEEKSFSRLVAILLLIFYILPMIFKYNIVLEEWLGGVPYLIVMYIMGAWLKLKVEFWSKTRSFWSVVLLCSSLGIMVGDWLQDLTGLSLYFYNLHVPYLFQYNDSLFVLVGSIALFMLFYTMKISVHLVNWVASSCVTVYILERFICSFLFSKLDSITHPSNILIQIFVVLVGGLIVFVIGIFADKFRQLFMTKFDSKIIDWELSILTPVMKKIEYLCRIN